MLPATPGFGDEAEAQTVPYILGIAHPTGFPAFTLAGWLFSHIVAFGTVAWRLNAFTALCSAVCVAGVACLAIAAGSDAVAAALAALAFAFGATFWNGALHANAQVLAEALGIWALVGAVRFARSGGGRVLVAACACCGVGLATHPAVIWIIPAIGVAMLWQWRALSPKLLAGALAAVLLPLCLYAYLPLRSSVVAERGLDPAVAAPLDGAGELDWDTNAPRTLHGFLTEVLGRDERAASQVTQAINPAILPAAASSWLAFAEQQYSGWAMIALAALGAIALARVDPRALSVLVAGGIGGIAFAQVYYRNAHLDRYLAVSLAIAAAFAAAATRLELPRVPPQAVRIAGALALAVTGGLALIGDRPRTTPPPFEDGAAIIAAAQQDTPADAIVVAQWNDAAALGYGAFIEHALGSRRIVAAWPYEYSDRYEMWARSRPVYIFASPAAQERSLPMWAQLRESSATLPQYRVFVVVPPRHKRGAHRM